jgi:hypothetical protein
VVLEGSCSAAGGLVVDVVERVSRGVGVAGLLRDLVGDAYNSVSYAFILLQCTRAIAG